MSEILYICVRNRNIVWLVIFVLSTLTDSKPQLSLGALSILTFNLWGWALIIRVLIKYRWLFATGTMVIITGALQQILTTKEKTTTQRTF